MMSMINITDPKVVGPGIWFNIHRDAYDAQTIIKQRKAIKNIKRECDIFPCPNCRQHCQDYIRDHPIEQYIGVMVNGKPLGIFLWTWEFHNAVNARTNKPTVNWTTACGLYGINNSNTCSKECTATENNVTPKNFALLKDLK